jgi:hypothetical protein
MPHKFNASRRHKFAKKRYRVTNWSSYNESLRQRGDVTVWMSPEVEDGWHAERRKTRGGQLVYSDLAITVCLTVGMVYKQPLRQTEGLVRGLVRLMGLDLSVPEFSTLSRRGAGLSLSEESKVQRDGPLHLVVDSTDLKIFGESEWLQNKHRTKAKRKSWRKLHLGLGLVSGDIVCSDLTNDDVGDTTALPDLLEQIDADVGQFIADGAYDGDPTINLLVAHFGVGVEIIIPPPKNAVPGPTASHDPSLRDRRIAAIRIKGRMARQVSSGYNQRSRGETKMGRWKTVIGPKLKARSFPNQKTEAKIGAHILNRLTELGRPVFEPVA